MPSRRRTAWWIAAVIVLLVAVSALYRMFARVAAMGPDLDVNQILLPTLSLALVVLALALAGVLIRNLVRLIVDRKRGIFGARLRTKLVFFFLALVLLPATVLFSGSAQIIKQSVEAILRTPLEDIHEQSRGIVDEWNAYFQDQADRRARAIAAEIGVDDLLAPERREDLHRLLQRWKEQDDRQLIWVAEGTRVVARAGEIAEAPTESDREELPALVDEIIRAADRKGGAARGIDRIEEGLLAHAVVPVPGSTRLRASVVVGIALPARLASNLDAIDRAAGAYRRFRAQRRDLLRLYLTLIGLVFLVTIFIATWIGLYVARRITGPIQELAAAAREISAGNLGVRVRTRIGDELGMLVDAFNEMAGELQENREVITRSTADLRRSNRALDERRRYIETLVANLSTAVISLDPLGRVTTANPAVERILGVSVPVGRSARGAFAEAGLLPLVDLLDPAAVARGEHLRRDLVLARGNRMLNVSVQISPLRGGGDEDLGTLVIVEDLTELLRAQKAAAWREVARRIAHEIKNPLTPIQLSAQRLRKKFDERAEDLGQVVAEATASIEREVGALKRLVDEFSQFARMPEVAPRPVALPELVESVQELYRGLSEIRWDVRIDPGVREVTLDPEQIRRMLINLVDNAVSAMDGHGTISIRAGLDGGGRLRLEVVDEGPGLPPEDRERIFSPYFSTKRRGSGLGLAIIHKIVTDHGGTIRLAEHEPHGVRFIIDLPAGPAR